MSHSETGNIIFIVAAVLFFIPMQIVVVYALWRAIPAMFNAFPAPAARRRVMIITVVVMAIEIAVIALMR